MGRWLSGKWSGSSKIWGCCHGFIYMSSGLNWNNKLMMSTCLPIVSPLEYNPPRRDSFNVIILNVDHNSIDHRHHVYIHSTVNTKLSFHLLSQDTRDRECWKVEAPSCPGKLRTNSDHFIEFSRSCESVLGFGTLL